MNPKLQTAIDEYLDAVPADVTIEECRWFGQQLFAVESSLPTPLLQQLLTKTRELLRPQAQHPGLRALEQLFQTFLAERGNDQESPSVGHYRPALIRAWENLRSFLHQRNTFVSLQDIRKHPVFQSPELKAWILRTFPKGLSYSDIQGLSLEDVIPPERTLRRGPQEKIPYALQQPPDILDLAETHRNQFSLLVDDLPKVTGLSSDRGFKDFQRMVLGAIRHDLQTTFGVPGKTFGYLIYRNLPSGAIFVEQVMSDYYRLVPKIKKLVAQGLSGGEKNFREELGDSSLSTQWEMLKQRFGEANLERWSSAITKYLEDYHEIVLGAFLQRVRQKDVFLASKSLITQVSDMGGDEGYQDLQAPADYDAVPPRLGFKLETVSEKTTGKEVRVWHKYNASKA